MMPTPAPTSTATITDQSATDAGSGVSAEMALASTAPSATPTMAPKMDNVVDSTRNCAMMSRRRAPSDLRTPISRVRSATATSMMFMMTIAPTMRPMAGSTTPASTRYCLILLKKLSAELDVSSTKLSFWLGRNLRTDRITSRTSSMVEFMISSVGLFTITASITPFWRLVRRRSGELYGATTNLSNDMPSALPWLSATPITMYGRLPRRSSLPNGSPCGKKCSFTSSPITTTNDPIASSCGEKTRPALTPIFLISK